MPADYLTPSPSRTVVARVDQRWAETTGAHLLVVDPDIDGTSLRNDLAARGVHTTVTSSTTDALVEYGRCHSTAVIVAPTAAGVVPVEFVETIRRFGSPFVVAVLDRADDPCAGDLMRAGSSAVIERPYDGATVWKLLQGSSHALDGQARVSFGPIELDARAFTVTVRGERLQDLPLKEFELLRSLMYRAPEVMSNDELRLAVWGAHGGQIPDNTLAVHVARLRNRLQGTARIRRIRGRGYALILD
ncbi:MULTISPECIES: winged helix-turn-helix domain-containing protein [unclassified Nocardioides]|uniref:winged helix-turn-helix domain-containing protein n=1 Tax=unclassified Nocardioides TaxID=2615069 RepID=UPI00360AAE1C